VLKAARNSSTEGAGAGSALEKRLFKLFSRLAIKVRAQDYPSAGSLRFWNNGAFQGRPVSLA